MKRDREPRADEPRAALAVTDLANRKGYVFKDVFTNVVVSTIIDSARGVVKDLDEIVTRDLDDFLTSYDFL